MGEGRWEPQDVSMDELVVASLGKNSLATCEDSIDEADYISPEEERHQLRMQEIQKLESFPVFERVDAETGRGKYTLDGVWVDTES
eukprot:9749726-Alexandrium_andersonii.AAC.1